MSLKKNADNVRRAGRGPDTELVHFTKRETAGLNALAKAAGGELSRNPKTGLLEAGFLDSMLPTILGVAANFVVPGSGMLVGGLTGAMQNKDDPLMGAALGAAGGYGGGQLAAGLQGAGVGAAQGAAAAGAAGNQAATTAAHAAAQQTAMSGLPAGALANEAAAAASQGLTEQGVANYAAADATKAFMQQPFYEQAGAGLKAAATSPGQFVEGMGGFVPTAKAAGMAAAPALYADQGGSGGSEYGDPEGRSYDYDAGFTGGTMTGSDPSSERRWFNPTYTQRLAEGGEVSMSEGGFVIPADVVSMAGNGSSAAGLEALQQILGATPIDGQGDGMSDDIPANIDGRETARVARQEAYLAPAQVKRLGGPQKLQQILARVRQQAHGKASQQRPVDLGKAVA